MHQESQTLRTQFPTKNYPDLSSSWLKLPSYLRRDGLRYKDQLHVGTTHMGNLPLYEKPTPA